MYGHLKIELLGFSKSLKRLENRLQNNYNESLENSELPIKEDLSMKEIPLSLIIKPLFMYDLINDNQLTNDIPQELFDYALSVQLERNDTA